MAGKVPDKAASDQGVARTGLLRECVFRCGGTGYRLSVPALQIVRLQSSRNQSGPP